MRRAGYLPGAHGRPRRSSRALAPRLPSRATRSSSANPTTRARATRWSAPAHHTCERAFHTPCAGALARRRQRDAAPPDAATRCAQARPPGSVAERRHRAPRLALRHNARSAAAGGRLDRTDPSGRQPRRRLAPPTAQLSSAGRGRLCPALPIHGLSAQIVHTPSEGCSKPQSTMARSSSGLSRKSRKPDEWMPTYPLLASGRCV